MVAPYKTGTLMRALVKVVGSGSGSNTDRLLLDLGRSSSFAASVNIGDPPETFTRSSPKSISEASPPDTKALMDTDPIEWKTTTKSDMKAGEPPIQSSTIGVARPLSIQNSSKVIKRNNVTANIDSKRAALVLLTLHEQQQSVAKVVTGKSDLEAKNVDLIAENKELQRKLSLFQQLFRDKKLLRYVVKRLGIDVVE